MQMFLALMTYLMWVKLNSRQTHGKHDSIGELNIFKNMYNKNFIHGTLGRISYRLQYDRSAVTRTHTHSLKCSVRVIALSQRTKHNSQPLKIHYKKLLHNFCSLLLFFLSSSLPDIYIISLQWWIFQCLEFMWTTLGMLGHAIDQTSQLLHHSLDQLLPVAIILPELWEDVVLFTRVFHLLQKC